MKEKDIKVLIKLTKKKNDIKLKKDKRVVKKKSQKSC